MRQTLTRRKRRKIRKVHARTGEVVEIMFRRDIDRLAKRWGLTRLAAAAAGPPLDVSARKGVGTSAHE